MKLLRITAEGLPLFKEKLDISFYARQRVMEDQKKNLYPLFSNIFLNPANGIIGINASGKTSLLKVILLVLGMMNNEPINHIETREVLGDTNKALFNIYFYVEAERKIFRLASEITSSPMKPDGIEYRIVSEKMWSKAIDGITTRKSFLNFDGIEPEIVRTGKEDYLLDDVSIMIALNKKTKEKMQVVNLLRYTNVNIMPFSKDVPIEVITYLDPTIEKLQFDEQNQKPVIFLKFKGEDEIVLNNPIELNNYLSSGTVKGIVIFTLAREVLHSGGYIVVDEIENHFNKEIAMTLMRLFMDSKLNKNGGTLIFSTHYPELLDEYDRNDSIYLVRNQNGITAENLSTILKRNDIKKSDAYQSGLFEGTTPMYEAYMQLKKCMAKALK